MTLKIGWLHEAAQSLGTWLHEADDWQTPKALATFGSRSERGGLSLHSQNAMLA
jgi:hypothetical protein